MNNRIKNTLILIILITFLLLIDLIPVTCVFKHVTGISCPSCGMTRAFLSILHLDFIHAFQYNILSIPFFFLIISSIFRLSYEIITNQFTYIPKLLSFFSKKISILIILVLLLISLLVNNLVIYT